MAILINEKYFKGEILIPNLISQGIGISDNICQANTKKLREFIEKYEPIFLSKLLGPALYHEFADGINTPQNKWKTLKETLANETTHTSPIANYIYYWFIRNHTTTTTGIGETLSQANNSTIVSPEQKMVKAWNDMVDNLTLLIPFINDNRPSYPNFCPDCNADIFFHINTHNL